MTVAIYARVSSDSQEARGTIGSQLEALRQKMSEFEQFTNTPTMGTPERAWTGPVWMHFVTLPKPACSSRSGA
jgi:hypothetical protein